MNFVIKNNRKLRTGMTTGTCAAAAAQAAALLLLSGESRRSVTVTNNQGISLTVALSEIKRNENTATCSVVKDAGDDPDVTGGIEIIVTVSKIESGIIIDGGEGIGRVTKPGLKIPVGHAAINPVPRQMIEREVLDICRQTGYHGGLCVLVSVPKGKEIAKKTMNERLGIVSGISILGTTGIVEPMSEKALIDTIKTEIDMYVFGGKKTLLLTPGNYGREFVQNILGLDIRQAIKCSNYIGEVLDYALLIGIENVTLVGHAGKLVKLAGGIMNTHSGVADCRMEIIAAHSAIWGVPSNVIREIMNCVTVEAAIAHIRHYPFQKKIWESIGQQIAFHLNARTKGKLPIQFIVFTQEEGILINSNTNSYTRNHDQ
ncbi:MAG: cobalt-precorrin-5B (C(1))-methyltransferase CbiD [Planctomycetaceae bacterium]|jgi:cobalt-precorrin-5B (C1)-methyltransferase|nr:cobalt-precorrin-5B (C(1))-methyltransferase CbiD [Planctomycetaceae bacterium]